jgi:hypothetical protein
MTATTKNLTFEEIRINKRHRKDLGDIAGLAASIAKVGLLHALVLNTKHELIAGERRLAAVKTLGWTKVPVHVVASLDDAAMALAAERDENECRKAFTPFEALALGRELEKLEKPKADQRQKAGKKPLENSSTGNGDASSRRTRDQVGAALGMHGTTYEKAKFVADKAEENPKLYAEFAEQMERTGKVDPAYRKAKRQTAFGHVPISETRIERTGGDALEDVLMSLNRRLLGIEHHYGTWKEIAAALGEEERQGLREITLAASVRHLQSIIKELS